MSSTKAALKAAKAALDTNNYHDAVDQAKAVLRTDPKNYHAYALKQITLIWSVIELTVRCPVMYSWAEPSKSWIGMKNRKKPTK